MPSRDIEQPHHDPSGELREPLDLLRRELAHLGERIEQLPVKGGPDPAQQHMRRYAPFYALLAVWVLMIAFFPSGGGTPADRITGAVGAQTGETNDFGFGTDTGAGAAGAIDTGAPRVQGQTGTGAGGGPAAAAGGPGATSAQQQGPAAPQVGSGVTRGGFECSEGARQIPWSSYAAPCVAEFTGNNGGATHRGVSEDTIIIASRQFPESANSAAVGAFAEAAGAASADVARQVRDTFREYFNEIFELYGRQVVWVEYPASSRSNGTDEAQSRGKEGACVDATRVAQEIGAFAVQSASQPYGECLAERGVVSFSAGAYFPESWYRRYHPYLWNTTTECERISHQVAEYVGKRLAGRQARWANDPVLAARERTFGVYVPNNDGYQSCVDIYERELERQYGVSSASRYNYTLDVSRFPDEAARAVVQFKAAGVTTIVNACDPISTTFLTQAATAQNYYPEWYIIGVAVQDVDSVARLYDQEQVDGSLFGMSQLGDQSKLWGPNSEPGRTYQHITGQEIPAGTEGGYYGLLNMFSALQAAGPNLNPETLAHGFRSLPPSGAPDFAVGTWSYRDGPDGTAGAGSHTAITDSREVYWCRTCTSKIDGREGTYIETYGGRRFTNGQWPAEEPPIHQ